MKDIVEEALMSFKPMLGMRRQVIICDFEDDVCTMVEPTEISLVIANLIENASKYTPEGGQITIKLHKEEDFTILPLVMTA